jgi:hypothetical protein
MVARKHPRGAPAGSGISRRELLQSSLALALSGATPRLRIRQLASGGSRVSNPDMLRGARPLVVQPVLLYSIPQRVPGRSWRSWGSLQSQEAVEEEARRISEELSRLSEAAGFPLTFRPVARVSSVEEAQSLRAARADVALVYAAGGWIQELNAACDAGQWAIIFVRYRSGPYYLWHEIVHSRFLRGHTDRVQHPKVGLDDVIVDDPAELLWRLRALFGLKNVLGQRIVCIGGPGGWETPEAPQRARERFALEMPTVPIPDIQAMIQAGRKDRRLMDECRREASAYIDAPGVTLRTTREAVTECFLLKKLCQRLMSEHKAWAVTTRDCMNSYAGIMPCLTLTLLNDEGYMAYCEGDFVVIPAGMLLHFISGQPTYFCNPTFPHAGRMMFAHCTAPRRMDGRDLEPVELVTHYESDHGAATHVLFRRGQRLTIVKPDFEAQRWLATTGSITDTPFLDTCRAQVEVQLEADTQEVLKNLRGFHCMLAYGDFRREIRYAAGKVGIQVDIPA